MVWSYTGAGEIGGEGLAMTVLVLVVVLVVGALDLYHSDKFISFA